jgi:hypothetical protein
MHPALLPDLMAGLDRCLQYYITKAKSGCGKCFQKLQIRLTWFRICHIFGNYYSLFGNAGSRNTFIPTTPALTRCTIGSKFQGFGKKKEKSPNSQKRNPQVATMNGDNTFGILQLCVRINTLQRVWSELDVMEKRIITRLRNSESAHAEDFSNGLGRKFELSPAACIEFSNSVRQWLIE